MFNRPCKHRPISRSNIARITVVESIFLYDFILSCFMMWKYSENMKKINNQNS